MKHHELRRGLTHRAGNRLKVQNSGIRSHHISRFLIFAFCLTACAFLCIGCGERENKNLVNARNLILQGKYKESQDIIKADLNVALEEDAKDPAALCPLKALKIIDPGTSTEARRNAVNEIVSLVRAIESDIEKLEVIERDLLTDDDKDKLDKLKRKWNLSLEPAVIILKSETDWITDVGQPAIILLIESLKVQNPMIQADIVELLVSLKDMSFETLIQALENKSSMVRRQALIALGRIGDERAVEPITGLLKDADPGVRFYIPVILDRIGGEKMIPALHEAVENETASVRISAIDILGRIEDETAIDLLIKRLADVDSYVKTSATNALIKIGEPAVPKLKEVLENMAENVSLPPTDFTGDKIGDRYKKVLGKQTALQVSAASILGSIKDPGAIESLLKAMQREADEDATETEKANAASVRSGASAALGVLGTAAVERLIEVLKSSQDENARVNAGSTLGTIGDKRAVKPLIDALVKDNKKSVRAAAAVSLGTLNDRRAVPSLIEALKDEDVVTKANAATSLGTIKDKSATQPLIGLIESKEEREKIRTAAITSLGTIKDTTALEMLVKVLVNEREKDGIRKTAASSLRTMENVWASEPLIALLKGEIVYSVLMPEKGVVSKWLKKEGERDRVENWVVLVEASIGGEKKNIDVPLLNTLSGGTQVELIKICVPEGETAETGTLLGLIAYEDKDIEQEERSSIRSAAASALGKVKGDEALSELMRSALKDKSAAVKQNAANSVWELDKADGRPALIKALKRDDSGIVRSIAALGLGKGALKGADGVPPLIHALRKDKYESTRVKAAWSLGEIGNTECIVPLIGVIVEGRKGRAEASAVVAEAITALDKRAGPAVDPLIAVLRNTDIDEVPRSKAARILGLIENTRATEALIEALKGESVVIRSEAAKALGPINHRDAVEPLIEMLKKDEWITARVNAAEALGKIRDERAVEPLVDALGSEVAAIRGKAVVALGLLKDKRATMPLIKIVENEAEDDTIRANAISSLSSIADPRAVDTLMAVMKTGTVTIRQNAVAALGEHAADAAVGELMGIVKDMNEPVDLRGNAAEALGKIGDKRAGDLLRERLGDKNESDAVWTKAGIAAGKLRVNQMPAWVSERASDDWETAALRHGASSAMLGGTEDLSVLLELLDDDTVAIRAGAALVLGDTGSKAAVQPLMDKLQGENKDGEVTVRRDSAKGLAALADPDSEAALIKAHKEDGEASVKNQSALALGNIKGKDGIAALIATVQDTSKGRGIRKNAVIALGNSGSNEAVSVLREALEDKIGVIHFEAAEALRKITGEDFGYER